MTNFHSKKPETDTNKKVVLVHPKDKIKNSFNKPEWSMQLQPQNLECTELRAPQWPDRFFSRTVNKNKKKSVH